MPPLSGIFHWNLPAGQYSSQPLKVGEWGPGLRFKSRIFRICLYLRKDTSRGYTCLSGHFLAHLSRRLTGELIGYPWIRRPSVVRPSVVRPFTFSNIFSSKTAWPIKAKFYVEPPWEGGTKVYINGPGHMTKMAAMPIYGKNPSKIFFSRTGGPIFMKLGI